MDATSSGLGALTLFVDDLDAVRSFYRDTLGLPLLFEDDVSAAFHLGGTVLNLLSVSAAPELVAPVGVAPVGAAAHMLLSLWVDDVDATYAELEEHGVTMSSGPIDRAWGKRTATSTDPAGTVWEIAQDIPAPTADGADGNDAGAAGG